MRSWVLFCVLCFSVFLFQSSAQAVEFPNPTGYVNDFAGVLDASQRASIEQTLRVFEQQTSNEISVAIVPSLEGLDRFTYANELFIRWKPGKADKNNGILFLVAIDDREAFVEVGKGLEGALPDSLVGTLLRKEVFPSFQAGQYAAGIQQGIAAIIQATKGEYKARPRSTRSGDWGGILNIFFPLGFVLIQYFLSFLARSKSWWLGGVMGGAGGVLLGFLIFTGLAIFITAAVFGGIGLLLDFVLSKNYQKRLREGKPTDFWHSGGGFWFGGGRGGGGGGGFGGFGGGISGGGGAGGRW